MKLIKLKDEKFEYCGVTYIQKRYVSENKKILIVSDGCDYVKIYTAQADGKAIFNDKIYYKGNYNSYPVYTIEDAIRLIKKYNITSEFELKINESQYSHKQKKIKVIV